MSGCLDLGVISLSIISKQKLCVQKAVANLHDRMDFSLRFHYERTHTATLISNNKTTNQCKYKIHFPWVLKWEYRRLYQTIPYKILFVYSDTFGGETR